MWNIVEITQSSHDWVIVYCLFVCSGEIERLYSRAPQESWKLSLKTQIITSDQDRGVRRYTLPPCTTKRRTTNLKTKNSQNCQKIQLYGSPTTKELKKKHSSILVGAAETAARTERACGKAEARRPGWAWRQLEDHVVSHSNADKPGGTTGERDTAQPRVPSQ